MSSNLKTVNFILAIPAMLLPAFIGWCCIYFSYRYHPGNIISPFSVIDIAIAVGCLAVDFYAIRWWIRRSSYTGSSPALFLVLFAGVLYFMIAVQTYNGYHTLANPVLVIDNGTDSLITVKINGTDVRVGPHGTINFTVPAGKLETTFNGMKTDRTIAPGEWIYNPGGNYSYKIETVAYSMSEWSVVENAPADKDLGSPEFFIVTTDYLLEAPDKITTEGSSDVTKTLLTHY
ncbi:MAG TPA: hypothetical protein VL651_06330 [Bacteroidia bacterium]|nr:hypothetical protein [Bacteroidia bacterium]